MRILNRYYSTYDLLLLLGDIVISFVATASVRGGKSLLGFASTPNEWVYYSLQGLAVGVVIVIVFYYADLYAIDQTLSIRELLLRFVNSFGIACIIIGILTYPLPNIGKSIYLSEMLLLGTGLGAWRLGMMRIIQQASIHGKVLIIGARAIGRVVAEQLCKQKKLGMEVVGFVGAEKGELTLAYGNPERVILPIYAPALIPALIERGGVNRILLAGSEGLEDLPARELVSLRMKGIPVEDCHSFYERLVSKIAIADLSHEWIVLAKGFRRDRLVIFAKRVIDVIASVIGLTLSAPLALITAIAIKAESRGPVLYRQERVGENESRFVLYKFRSMAENAEDGIGPVWAAENDPRVTRVGKLIRKLRIDEIPQMVNVLKGEMSFVGPRPERPFFVEKLKGKIPYYYLRHTVKPGVTGWAQISYPYGDTDEGAIEKLEYDLYYIKNMSALFDLQIIFESFKVILLGRGAR